ncbi:MAG: trehalose utilization protein ThuA [Clostridiales bacterium]|nr:trehalose utilization protein ThuA [Clostridiales bacterium]
MKTRVTIYNEGVHEQTKENVRAIYPNGIHGALKEALETDEVSVSCYTLDTVNEITDEVLDNTDVMLWWGHARHAMVPDEVAARVRDAVLKGMGIVFLHSGHHSKPFRLLMGTSCNLTWRENGDMERLWVVNPAHPITQGLGRYFELPHVETYGEPFGIPEPDEVLFIGWYSGGEVFRSGCTFHRGNGRIFYFQPGHETFPIFYDENVRLVIRNAVKWAKPIYRVPELLCPHVKKPGEEE